LNRKKLQEYKTNRHPKNKTLLHSKRCPRRHPEPLPSSWAERRISSITLFEETLRLPLRMTKGRFSRRFFLPAGRQGRRALHSVRPE